MKRILFLFIIFLVSCRSLDSVQKFRSVDTVVLRDSVYRHDTVYITKEVYRNASHSTLNAQHSTHSDTVIVTEWRERVVQKPPERYIPRFYRWCTILLFALITLMAARWWLKRYWMMRL